MTRRRRRALLILSAAAGSLAWAASGVPSRWAAGRAWDRGVSAALSGDYERARGAFSDCLKARPDRQDCQAGLRLAEKAAAPAPALDAARLEAEAERLLAAREASTAPGAPMRVSERVRQAESLYRAGRTQEAYDLASQALAEDRDDLVAQSIVQLARPKSSVPAAPAASDDDKKRAVQHWVQGVMFFQKNEMAKSRDEWLLCKKFDPANSECAQGLARLDAAGSQP